MFPFFLIGCAPEKSDTANDTSSGSDTGFGVVAAYEDLNAPRDAAPDAEGANVYFLAEGTGWNIYQAPFDGSGHPSVLTFVTNPMGLVVADDDSAVFVSDTDGVDSVPMAGGADSTVAGTEGTRPQGLDYATVDGVAKVVFTGTAPADGAPALLEIPAAGGTLQVVAEGSPFVDPSGVVVADEGRIYVVDRAAGSDGGGAVIVVGSGSATILAQGFVAGDPAGISLEPGDGTLLVSALDATGHSEVLLVDAASGETSVFNDVISANTGSGGLHRAEGGMVGAATGDPATYAWCGATAGGTGSVYQITLK